MSIKNIKHVISFIAIIHIISIITILSFLQLRVDLGIVDHVWQEKHNAIAMTVNSLGDEFKPAMSAGWLAYIRKTYPDGAAAAVDAIGEGTLVLDYD